MDKTTLAILRALDRQPLDLGAIVPGFERDALDADGRWLVDNGYVGFENRGADCLLVCTPAGREVLEGHRGRVRRWLAARLDTLASAFITALITAFVTAFVTAWVAVRFEVSRRMPYGVFRDLRCKPEGCGDCRGDCHADDEQSLSASHHTNSVALPAMHERPAD